MVQREVSALSGSPIDPVEIDPYSRVRSPRGISFDTLIDDVLEPLVRPQDRSGSADRVVVVNASRAPDTDTAAWRLLFRRLNETRNLIANRLDSSLLVCLPPWLEPLFAHEAPDFWSIRSGVVTLRSLPQFSPVVPAEQAAPSKPPSETRPSGDIEALNEAVAEARMRASTSPEDASSLRALAIQLNRLGSHLVSQGALSGAHSADEEAVTAMRRLLGRNAPTAERLRDLAASLMALGDVQQRLGQAREAHATFTESVDVMRHSVALAQGEPELVNDLATSLILLGDAQFVDEDAANAGAAYREALSLIREILQRTPNRVDRLRNLSFVLNRIARLQLDRSNYESSLEAAKESVAAMRSALESGADQPELLHDLSFSLSILATSTTPTAR